MGKVCACLCLVKVKKLTLARNSTPVCCSSASLMTFLSSSSVSQKPSSASIEVCSVSTAIAFKKEIISAESSGTAWLQK